MKIKWRKIAAGIYQDDSGRFRAVKYAPGLWFLTDNHFGTTLNGDSLREAKQLADDQLEYEATK